MAITFRTQLGQALTHAQMDENFSSLYYSSSLHDSNTKLRLWFKEISGPDTYHEVLLPTPGDAGTVTITDDGDNRIITANGDGTIQGEENFLFDGSILTLTGRFEPADAEGNIAIGTDAGLNATATDNVIVGNQAGQNFGGEGNIAIGSISLANAAGQDNTALGFSSLTNLTTGHSNTAIGSRTGENVGSGAGNIYIGYAAGPATSTPSQNNKLYINNSPDDTPLILGDFVTGQVTISNQISASVFSGSFVGNGSALTGVTSEWDGTRNGNAEITGSLIVSGAVGTTVNLTGVSAISGSVFSGSFVGDGSGLTGIVANSEWDGTRNGNAEITGSFIVSGSSPTIELKGNTTIDENIVIFNPKYSSISIGESTNTSDAENVVAIGYVAGADAQGFDSVMIGTRAGIKAGNYTTYVGALTGLNNTGERTVAIGSQALFNAQNASATVAVGMRALSGMSEGKHNTSVGFNSLPQLESGDLNTVIGSETLQNLIAGQANTAVGYGAGSYKLNKGNGNVYLGANTGRPDIDVEYNQLYIDNKQTNEALIRGDFEQRTLTLNALQVIIPNLPTDPSGLPIGALYRNGDFVLVKTS